MDKTSIIRSEGDLISKFRELVGGDFCLKWQIPPEDPLGPIELKVDDRSHCFRPVFFLRPSIQQLESLVSTWPKAEPPLLIAPELSERVLEFCIQKKLSAVDLNGRVYVRAPGILIDRRAQPGREFRFQFQPRDIFSGKSARIIRTLLTDRDRVWGQSELVHRSKASPGLVSRIVQHLVNEGHLEKKSAREFRLTSPYGLVDAWVKADNFARRVSTTRYTIFVTNPYGIAKELNSWAESQSTPIAFTQWLAAWLRHAYTDPVIASAYVTRLPEPATLARIGLRPVTDAGKVWLHVTNDEGIFMEKRTVQGIPLVSDAQIYVDLQQTGLRGPEQAAALREWDGFCRP